MLVQFVKALFQAKQPNKTRALPQLSAGLPPTKTPQLQLSTLDKKLFAQFSLALKNHVSSACNYHIGFGRLGFEIRFPQRHAAVGELVIKFENNEIIANYCGTHQHFSPSSYMTNDRIVKAAELKRLVQDALQFTKDFLEDRIIVEKRIQNQQIVSTATYNRINDNSWSAPQFNYHQTLRFRFSGPIYTRPYLRAVK